MEHSSETPFPYPIVEAFRKDPDVPAFEYRGRPVSRRAVLDLIARCAGGLRAAGLGPGSPVALATGVTPEAFAAQIAALLLGARVTGLRPGLTPVQLGAVLPGMAAVVTDPTGETPELLAAAGTVPVLRIGRDLLGAGPPADGTRPQGGAGAPDVHHPTPETLTAEGRPDDIALITLTSGSTGVPKGCGHSYRACAARWPWRTGHWDARTAELAAGYRRFLLFGSFANAVVLDHLTLCLLSGGTAVIPDPPPAFPEVIARHRPTAVLMAVPRLHQVLDTLRTDPVDTGSLRVVLVAGSPLAPHRLAEATELLGPVVHHAYGQTETGMLALLTPQELVRDPDLLDTVGRPWADTEVSVRDDDDHPLPTGATGEIWVRTPSAMSGYWQNEAETREVLRPDGWVRTRDLGHLDERGYLRLTGRSRDVIIINAAVHYAGPIEQVLTRHPDVDQAYVVAAPDERTGEAAHAFLVPGRGRAPDLAALRASVAAELGADAVPATFTLLDRVPVTPGGKPDKRALLDRLPADGGS
ncbi:long-chain fatty acid--CoA ligase [Streptomyces pactum]|uniref:Long-chain fatty acid--CoA ligase n=1 Tax=Streptomyces pactum TaxID=68249 RepID=A0ABS0NT78_9ACTN|nr:long-chain fatty acid--CoA ligase [Streptomyces pactum]MBH5338356.1 long-chain fatty acid--CoA ligase [Streptomyces pactum]